MFPSPPLSIPGIPDHSLLILFDRCRNGCSACDKFSSHFLEPSNPHHVGKVPKSRCLSAELYWQPTKLFQWGWFAFTNYSLAMMIGFKQLATWGPWGAYVYISWMTMFVVWWKPVTRKGWKLYVNDLTKRGRTFALTNEVFEGQRLMDIDRKERMVERKVQSLESFFLSNERSIKKSSKEWMPTWTKSPSRWM